MRCFSSMARRQRQGPSRSTPPPAFSRTTHRPPPIETFTASFTDRHTTELAGLAGRAARDRGRDRGGPPLGREPHQDADRRRSDPAHASCARTNFEYLPQLKLLISGNHKPGLRSVDEAIRRRFHLIPFTVTIPPEERDPELAEKLKAEWPGDSRLDDRRLPGLAARSASTRRPPCATRPPPISTPRTRSPRGLRNAASRKSSPSQPVPICSTRGPPGQPPPVSTSERAPASSTHSKLADSSRQGRRGAAAASGVCG